jgi:hypothetical protein
MRNNQRFCTRCLAYYCDHAMELDFEWTAEDEAAVLAADLPDVTSDAEDADPENNDE